MITVLLDLVLGSASAKWAVMAPVFVPMFMLLGYSPELTQAGYRIGDSVANIITPLMSYFPLVVAFRAAIRQACWDRDHHGDNVALLSDFFLSLDAALNRLVSVGTAIRPGRGHLLHAGNSIPVVTTSCRLWLISDCGLSSTRLSGPCRSIHRGRGAPNR
jgi:hypothetical protein